MANRDSAKKGTRFGFNTMDLIILLLVLVCIVGAVIRARQIGVWKNESELESYEIYFSVSDIAYTSEDALVPGDTVTLCDSGTVIGTLQSLDSILPSTMYVKDADGNVLSINYPESTRIDVTGTIHSTGVMSPNGYLAGGITYLAPGMHYSVRSEHMDFQIEILRIGNS